MLLFLGQHWGLNWKFLCFKHKGKIGEEDDGIFFIKMSFLPKIVKIDYFCSKIDFGLKIFWSSLVFLCQKRLQFFTKTSSIAPPRYLKIFFPKNTHFKKSKTLPPPVDVRSYPEKGRLEGSTFQERGFSRENQFFKEKLI